jgi:hypothetical protein
VVVNVVAWHAMKKPAASAIYASEGNAGQSQILEIN